MIMTFKILLWITGIHSCEEKKETFLSVLKEVFFLRLEFEQITLL